MKALFISLDLCLPGAYQLLTPGQRFWGFWEGVQTVKLGLYSLFTHGRPSRVKHDA